MSPASRQYKEIEIEVRIRISLLEQWEKTGELPGRVCKFPSDARSHFCLHAAHCFTGWEPPTLAAVVADETVIAAVATVAEAKRARADIGRDDKAWEAKQKAAQEVLERADMPVGVTRVGPYQLTRTHTRRAATFEWGKAELAGVFVPDDYPEFFRAGASYSTFKAERIAGETDDYGDDIPWDD
jgi:hypothetical protein